MLQLGLFLYTSLVHQQLGWSYRKTKYALLPRLSLTHVTFPYKIVVCTVKCRLIIRKSRRFRFSLFYLNESQFATITNGKWNTNKLFSLILFIFTPQQKVRITPYTLRLRHAKQRKDCYKVSTVSIIQAATCKIEH